MRYLLLIALLQRGIEPLAQPASGLVRGHLDVYWRGSGEFSRSPDRVV
jgi:hypothetical protein